ncbi:hypothetical protein FRB95_004104 [Tulasnella sp. JGI-2019a]|nr:hypothetical protein FRB95_004104 [Tulasnella sp. JGI-2019a]
MAAAGAVLAKQWLQSYERTGQTGSRQKQAMLRTQKWMGADSWGLRPVVEALPTFLLVSLALFFAALCDFLWSTSKPVAIVVLAFPMAGAVFYGITVIAAAIDVFCPYQTTVSRVIRELALESRNLLPSFSWTEIIWRLQVHYPRIPKMEKRMRTTMHQVWTSIGGHILVQVLVRFGRRMWTLLRGDSLWRWIAHTRSKLSSEKAADSGPEDIYAHSILWMLENATEEEDILTCAENVPALTSLSSTQIVSHSPLFSTLVQRFNVALTDVVNRVEGSDHQSALILGRAVTHVVIADPIRWANAVAWALNEDAPPSMMYLYVPRDLWVLSYAHLLAPGWIPPDLLWMPFVTQILPSSEPSTVFVLSLMKLSHYGIPFQLVDSRTARRDFIFNLLCLEVIDLAQGLQRPLEQRSRDVWSTRGGGTVGYVTKTVEAHDRLISRGVDRRGLLAYHTEVLKNYRSSHTFVGIRLLDVHAEAIRRHLSRVLAYRPPGDQTPAIAVKSVWEGQPSSWEERLSQDPLIQVEILQAELMAYGTQLLFCLVPLWIDDHRHWYTPDTRFTPEEAGKLVDDVSKLQAGFITDLDIAHALKAIDLVVSGLPDTLSNLTQCFNSICPLLTRAFESTSDNVSDFACGVLSAFGDMAWEEIDRPKTNLGLLLTLEFASAALRSLCRSIEIWSRRNDRALIRWLAASIRSDAALATNLDESNITSLFTSKVSGISEEEHLAGDQFTMWYVAYLFLKRWHSTLPNTISLDTPSAPGVADAVMETLSSYSQTYLSTCDWDITNVELFAFIAAFIQQAFILRPSAALFFRLDLASEGLGHRTKVWAKDLARRWGVDGMDIAGEEAKLATLALGWARARKAYVGLSCARDETLQYANSAGFWKHGGLSRLCGGLGGMLI